MTSPASANSKNDNGRLTAVVHFAQNVPPDRFGQPDPYVQLIFNEESHGKAVTRPDYVHCILPLEFFGQTEKHAWLLNARLSA
ncbi:unnamed protein product [Didymodactylos carnosus]|uniref:Uncharacterized protein n=1 Tax=Didymodactylos carnosus TaxID=1234261 RepID=A0A814Y9V0_9BILA|nr:unnamed protein product [Didymodactylos carnosus]CAF3988941.1 unnamed protein product [Didymodactylos carnosus]